MLLTSTEEMIGWLDSQMNSLSARPRRRNSKGATDWKSQLIKCNAWVAARALFLAAPSMTESKIRRDDAGCVLLPYPAAGFIAWLYKSHGTAGAIMAGKGCNSDENISRRKETLFPIERVCEVHCDVTVERRRLRIGICEDSVPDAELIREYLSGWEAEVDSGNRPRAVTPGGVELRISEFPDAEAFYFNYPDNPLFDVLLLDIHMGDMDGFELAKKIRQRDRKIAVVFITGDPDYASKGYDVDAAGYLIKPVRRGELYAVMDKCLMSLKSGKTELLWETDGELHKIYQEDILYFESAGHMITAVTTNGSFERRIGWGELESSISPDMFARTHRSYIVGLGHVDVLGKTEVTLDNGTVLPVSRRLEKELRVKFVGFYSGDDGMWRL